MSHALSSATSCLAPFWKSEPSKTVHTFSKQSDPLQLATTQSATRALNHHYFSSLIKAYINPGMRAGLTHSKDTFWETQGEILRATLSRGILDRQPNGTLRWKVHNSSGSPEYRIFNDEARLDDYLSQNELIDIWEIDDKRASPPKTIYKCCDPDETVTCKSQDELYHELAYSTNHGVFCIHDLDTHDERYICQQKGWLHTGFEEVTVEKAQ